jgi:hypothetical protein
LSWFQTITLKLNKMKNKKINILFAGMFLLAFNPTTPISQTPSHASETQNDAAALCGETFSAYGTEAVDGCVGVIQNVGANNLTCSVATVNLTTYARIYLTNSDDIASFVGSASTISNCTTGGGSGTNPGATSGGTTPNSGSCGDGMESVNGVCVPVSGFSGLAGAKNWQELAKMVINILLTVSGVIAVLFIIYGGFLYITSAGNEEQVEKGRKALVNSIIGLVVIILSYVLVNVITKLITS